MMNTQRAVGLLVVGVGLGGLVSCIDPAAQTPGPGTGGASGGTFGSGGFFGTGGFFDTGSGSDFGCATTGNTFSSTGGSAIGSSFLPPQFGATVTPAVAPPALSGGTLRVLHDGHTVAVADPDRDRVMIVDLTTAKIKATVALTAGDEPGRIVEDAAGRVHVALRHGGAVATVSPSDWTAVTRRAVCPAPRGLAYDAKKDQVHVACTDGRLISLPAAGGTATRTVNLDQDLRDVVVDGDHLLVTRFRSAQVLTLDAAGKEEQRLTPATFRSFEAHGGQLFSPSVAWRMVEMPGGGAAMVHQRGMTDQVASQSGGYGSLNPCDAIVQSTVTVMKPGMTPASTPAIPGMVLAVDMAISPDGKRIALIAAGNATNAAQMGQAPGLPRVFVTDVEALRDSTVGCRADGRHGPCQAPMKFLDGGGTGGAFGTGGVFGTGGDFVSNGGSTGFQGSGGTGGSSGPSMPVGTGSTAGGIAIPASTGGGSGTVDDCRSTKPTGGAPDIVGQPIAVGFDSDGLAVVQTREPAALYFGSGAVVSLAANSRQDTGHAVFHSNAGGFMACASCHPEGADDGRIWNFTCEGDRRTQALNVGIAGTEPFHWNGDMKTFSQLMDNVFVARMSGPKLAREELDATLTWIDRQPRTPVAVATDTAAVDRGHALFNDATTAACATCHAGTKFTNNMTVDVGTGGLFQVPSLVGVSGRAPYMHNGCAKTLTDRFGAACGGGDKHGVTSKLTAAQIADLVAFMNTL